MSKCYLSFCAITFVLITLLAFGRAAASPILVSEPSAWKLPLPAGDWVITQGPQDTLDCARNPSTHCSGTWNICAVDFVKVVGQQDPNKNQPVLAPADGTIIQAGYDASGGGNYLQIEHGDGGRVSLFLHLNSPLYTATTLAAYKRDHGNALPTVRPGDVIGYMGWGGTGYHLHYEVLADKNANSCVSMLGIDGVRNLAANQTVASTNRQGAAAPTPAPIMRVAPQPTVAPPRTAPSDSPDPWDTNWLPSDRNRASAAIETIITSADTGGSPNAGLKGYGATILNYALASVEGNPAGVNPAFALAMFRKEANFATNGAAAVNNNPGNIICANGNRPLYGAIRCNGRFGVYASMDAGIKAYFWLLQAEYKPGGAISRNCPDIPCIIRAYAPASENNTNLYIAQVTSWTKDFQNRIASGALVPPSAAQPTLSSPSNGANLSPVTDVTLAWNSATNATQYKVQLWGGPYALMTPCDWQPGTTCHIGVLRAGTMQWQVIARGADGREIESDAWSFTIQPNITPTFTPTVTSTPLPPSAGRPSLASPSNGASMPSSTDVTLRWNSASNATQYKVQVWGGPYSLMTPCDWQSATSCRIGTMWAGTMQWHVKARNANGQETDWSDTWSFTIQPTITPTFTPTPTPTFTPIPPSANRPTLASPGNGANMPQNTDVTLVWNGAANATQYKVELWGGPYALMTPCNWQSDTRCHIGTLWAGTMQWHVKARNAIGQETAWSDTWSFTIQQPPSTPTSTPKPATPGRVILTQGLVISPSSPTVGQNVNAKFKVKNDGGQPITLRFFGVKGRHSSGASYDFLWMENFTLQPGQEFQYDVNRPLDRTGTFTFTPNYSPDGVNWSDLKFANGSTSYATVTVR